jgi:hypothetical protein
MDYTLCHKDIKSISITCSPQIRTSTNLVALIIMRKARDTILSAQIQQFAFQKKNRLTEVLDETNLSSIGVILIVAVSIIIEYSRYIL